MTNQLSIVKDGALIEFSSSYQIEYFLRYPLRYLIQFGTRSRVEHIAIFYKEFVYESLLFFGMTFFGRIKKAKLVNRIKNLESQIEVNCYNLKKPLTKKEATRLELFLENALLQKKSYSTLLGVYMILDKLPFMDLIKIPEKWKNCSKFVFQCYQSFGRLSIDDDANDYSPIEVVDYAKKLKLIKRKIRIDKLG